MVGYASLFFQLGIIFKEIRDGFDAFVVVEKAIMLVWRVDGIGVKPEAHKH
jgi:hypothetical protein